jgi:hypothetical protein
MIVKKSAGKRDPRSPRERLMARSETQPNGCVLWTGGCDGRGYGMIHANGKAIKTHRLAYLLAHGSLPEGLLVCHNCPGGDNPRCINPEHLFLGTPLDNVRDMIAKGRKRQAKELPMTRGDDHWSRKDPSRVARGATAGGSKIDEQTAVAIVRLLSVGTRQTEIARQLGTTYQIVHAIKQGETWRHLTTQDSASSAGADRTSST